MRTIKVMDGAMAARLHQRASRRSIHRLVQPCPNYPKPTESMKTKTIEALPGNHIATVCKNACEMAKTENCNVEFDFNGQKLTATPDSDPEALAQSYFDECDRRHREYIASPEYKAWQEEAARKERERKAKVEAILADAPPTMSLADAEGWEKAKAANSDPYGGAVMTYAERWARMMEVRMAKGERIADIADECSHLADEEGITGFMYGCAVSTLARVWKHGEALRLWHNLKTQLRDEGEKANESGGVLNPACLSLG